MSVQRSVNLIGWLKTLRAGPGSSTTTTSNCSIWPLGQSGFVRGSQYDRGRYRGPITEKSKLDKPLDADDERPYYRIKAATNQSSFAFYSDPLIDRFINVIQMNGDKRTAREVVEKALEKVKRIQLKKWKAAESEEERSKICGDPRQLFHTALRNVTPMLKIMNISRAGSYYKVPSPMTESEMTFRGMKLLRTVLRDKPNRFYFDDALAKEILDAVNGEGRAIKAKQDLHRLCDQNRAYAHFRWSKGG